MESCVPVPGFCHTAQPGSTKATVASRPSCRPMKLLEIVWLLKVSIVLSEIPKRTSASDRWRHPGSYHTGEQKCQDQNS